VRAAVVGTGSMGPEIAAALAGAGCEVILVGRDDRRVTQGTERARALLGATGIAGAVIGPDALAGADLVVETISEDADAKRALYAAIESWVAPECVIATNTSSLQIAELARDLIHPGRFAGLHFLKPAHLTAVVELIPGPETDAATGELLRDLAGRMDKAPLMVRRDVPGFIWNRIQFAVLRECLHMLEQGVATAEDIDAAMSDGLAPRWTAAGPLATADLGGLATFSRICAQLFPHLANDTEAPAAMVDAAAGGRPLQEWTRRDGIDIEGLRADALANGRRIAQERRGRIS
jgi:3-hydroxybutyryl-CoA dehydrogenase